MDSPKYNTNIRQANSQNINAELEEFLKKDFEFPPNNSDDIIAYINEDSILGSIVCDLPEIISKEFPQCPIKLDLMASDLPDEIELEIEIKTHFDGETTSDKKDMILEELFSRYERPTKPYFISMDF